jgi:hypothetical protein
MAVLHVTLVTKRPGRLPILDKPLRLRRGKFRPQAYHQRGEHLMRRRLISRHTRTLTTSGQQYRQPRIPACRPSTRHVSIHKVMA